MATHIISIPHGVYFDDKKNNHGYCFVCDIAITSRQVHNQHVEGRKHKNKFLATKGLVEGTDGADHMNMMRCDVCKVNIWKEEDVQEHMSTRHRHDVKENMNQALTQKEAAKDQALTKTVESSDTFEKMVAATNDHSATVVKTVATSTSPLVQPAARACQMGALKHTDLEEDSQASPGSINPTPRGQMAAQSRSQTPPRDAQLNDLSKKLNSFHVCGSAMNIPPSLDGNVEQHLPAPPPPEARAPALTCDTCSVPSFSGPPALPPPEARAPALSCDTCSVPSFSGPESAADHFKSENHKQKVYVQGLVCTGTLPRDPETGALKVRIGGTEKDQYICDVCFCLTNSPVSYKQHVDSVQHKKKFL